MSTTGRRDSASRWAGVSAGRRGCLLGSSPISRGRAIGPVSPTPSCQVLMRGNPARCFGMRPTGWLRLTAGWSVGRALVYGTGGLAVAHDEVRRTQHRANASTLTTDPTFTESDRATRVGHVVGAGVAWHLGGDWSVRAAYLHARMPRSTAHFPDARGGAQASYSSVQGRIAERRSTFNTLRIGLDWTFRGL